MKTLYYLLRIMAFSSVLYACDAWDHNKNELQDEPEEKGITVDPDAERYNAGDDTTGADTNE
ncbi:MAG TPA: hypothetical protein VD905_09055 [Flavobacteriales bacterium]|nr:hypothetical protein [Flavobacteriales bacterium]